MPSLPRVVIRRLDTAGRTLKEITDGTTEDLYAVNRTDRAWTVTLLAEFWQTVDETTGQVLRHGPWPKPVTLLPGQQAQVGDIRGWEWDSQLEMTLVCRDVAGREVRRSYWLNGPAARESREAVEGLGEVGLPEPISETTPETTATVPEGWLAQQRSWALSGNPTEAASEGWYCCSLGRAYENGEGVAADPCAAALWYHRGAALGDAGCQAALARLLEAGAGVPPDSTAARTWHEKAAEGGEAESALWLAARSPAPSVALAWLRHGCRAGDRRCMIGAARLLINGDGDREEIAQWIQRAAELGEPEAQIRLAEMLAAEDAWPRHRVHPDRKEAAYWLAVAGSRQAPSVLPWRLRQFWERVRGLFSSPRTEPPPLLPVAELTFSDLPRIGFGAMQTLLRHCDKDDLVLALLPSAVDAVPRPVRHFVLASLSGLAGSMVMRDMLRTDVSDAVELPLRSRRELLDRLRDLTDDGDIILPDDLATDLRQRERRGPPATGPYGAAAEHASCLARHHDLARRSTRGAPIAPPEDPPPGWYADGLERQPNAVLRIALKAVGEGHLLCFLAGASPFLRFRIWQVSWTEVRKRLVQAAGGYPVLPATPENAAAARLAMDAALARTHRDGRIGWWDA